ncbi:hypothetical protein FFH90_003450 [Pseudomonas sp. ATCC 43928]|nr:hypothetical protein FFH90_003450 [Pseudomonas sp. ATCC 43928]
MDNFMEQPTYKMNRGAILTQGWRWLAGRLQPDESAGNSVHLLSRNCDKRWQASSRCSTWVSISHSAVSGAS